MTYRFHELEFFTFVNFLQTEDVFQAGLAKVALLHLQNRIRLTRSDIKHLLYSRQEHVIIDEKRGRRENK